MWEGGWLLGWAACERAPPSNSLLMEMGRCLRRYLPRTPDAICGSFRGRRRNFVYELIVLEVFRWLGREERRVKPPPQKPSRSRVRTSNVLYVASYLSGWIAMARARECGTCSGVLIPISRASEPASGGPRICIGICFLALRICQLLFLKVLGVAGWVRRRRELLG